MAKEKKQEEKIEQVNTEVQPIEEPKIDAAEIKELLEKEEVKEMEEVKEIEKMSREEFLLERDRQDKEERLSSWKPKTKLGLLVKEGKIRSMDEIIDKKMKVMESEIADSLLQLKSDLILIGQSKGKFGGGKRRAWKQTQRKTKEGNVSTFACMVIVGDGNGHIGLGYGKSKETLPAREKALRDAKLNIIRVKRGCGGFDCSCHDFHSVPFKTSGKVSSSEIVLYPAPKGTGLVIDDECKKILKLAGIKDVYSKTFGQTRTKINLSKACVQALEKLK